MSTSVKSERLEIRVDGKTLFAPFDKICGRTVVVTGNHLRKASVMDEDVTEGEIVADPVAFLEGFKKSRLRADILTFAQKLPETTPKYDYPFVWGSYAVIPITSYNDWWEKRLPQETRKNVRRAAKRGVILKIVPFSDELVQGIQGIYNENPIRQGRRFWHYGKDFETVKKENGTYLERSDFIGAYFNEELIGFIKLIYVDRVALLIQILAKSAHQDKRPIHILLARAVELCEQKGISYLLYGKYVYNRDEKSPFTEFKRRIGFEEVKYPRYFIPLTAKGRVAIKLGLHKGAKELIPLRVLNLMKSLRAQFYRSIYSSKKTSPDTVQSVP